MAKFIFVTLEITDGGGHYRKYYVSGAHKGPDHQTAEQFADNIAKHWEDYDEEDKDDHPIKQEDGSYQFVGSDISVKVEKAIEIPEAHYKIIKQYI